MKENCKKNGWRLPVIAVLVLAFVLSACQPAKPAPTATPNATLSAAATANAALSATKAAGSSTSGSGANTVPLGSNTPAGPAGPTPTPLVLAGATTTKSGLQYLEVTPGTGETPKQGQIITMQYKASLPDGTELANTYTANKPVTTVWGPNRLIPGWEEGIGLMKVGGKAKLVIPPDLAFGAQGSGSIPPNSQVVIEMDLLSSKAAPNPTDVAADKLTKTTSGLQYYDIAAGDGAQAVKNSNVTTAFVIWVKTDKGFDYIDQSDEGSPLSFVVGRGDTVFPGWDEGVTGMKVGGKRLLVVPPALALGDKGNNLIPANSTLVMEIQLVKATEPRVPTKVDEKDYTTTKSGLKYYDITPGTGATPTTGQTVVVHYTGWLKDGTQFDSSVDSGQPFTFTLGTGGVIPGWDEGVATMKVGGKRQLVVPPELGYGAQGAGSVIPPNATLVFEVELLDVQAAK